MGISACLRGKREGPTPGRQHADLDMRRAILISRTYILALESFMMIPGYRMMATHSNDRDVGRKYFSDGIKAEDIVQNSGSLQSTFLQNSSSERPWKGSSLS